MVEYAQQGNDIVSNPVTPLFAHPMPAARRLRGGWLVGARLAWVVLALLTLIYTAVSVPIQYAQLQTVCPTGPCETGLFSASDLPQLAAIGLSTNQFVAYVIGVKLAFAMA